MTDKNEKGLACLESFSKSCKLLVAASVLPLALGQSNEDARRLLREVAGVSRNLNSYRAEGHIVDDLDRKLLTGKENYAFHFAIRVPDQMRLEVSGGEAFVTGLPFLAICNSKTGWVYYSKPNKYEKVTANSDNQEYCKASLLTNWSQVDQEVKSAVVTGRDKSKFDGRLQACVVVQAQYRVIDQFLITPPIVTRVGRVSRTMCIDPSRKLILRDHLEADITAGAGGGHVNETITYENIERDVELAADLFEFHPPKNAKRFEPAPLAAKTTPPVVPNASNLSHVFARPEPIFKTEPEYSQEAWDEGIQGKVILTVAVETDGSMHDFKVEQSLGYGLDEKAIECVRKWSFRSATQDGKPVPGRAYITMDFVLPDKRPPKASPFPVSRPTPVTILPKGKLRPLTDRDEFFYAVAHAFRAPDFCQRIDPMAEQSRGNNWDAPSGMEIETLQSRCYFNLAVGLANSNLCNYVKPVRVDGYDGREFNASYCRNEIPAGAKAREGPLSPPEGDVPDENLPGFVHIMQQLGYSNNVLEYVYARSWSESPTTTAK